MRRLSRFPNPKFSPADEERMKQAEVFSTRATITEMGVGEFLKTQMPCGDQITTAAEMLHESADLRAQGHAILEKVKSAPARRKKKA